MAKSSGKNSTAGKKPVARILNCLPSRDTASDWSLATAVEAGVMAAAPPVPPEKDLRAAWWKVGDQGTTGSCVGWATADSVLRWHFTAAGRLEPKQQLSIRYVWMAAKETDDFATRPTTFIEEDGTSLKAALDVARKLGVVPEDTLAFDGGKLYPGDAKTFYAVAALRRISSYFSLGRKTADWKKWIAANGPILARLDVDSTWRDATANGGQLKKYRAATAAGGHAVAIVGYTPEHFIVRNSWGTKWGDKGFAYASPAYAAEAFTEVYGVRL